MARRYCPQSQSGSIQVGANEVRGISKNQTGCVRAIIRTRRLYAEDCVLDSAHHGDTSVHSRLFGCKAPAAPVAAAPVATPERHPHIDEALEHMRAAKHELEVAEHDFDGHRVKSIEHLSQAMHEAEICMGMK